MFECEIPYSSFFKTGTCLYIFVSLPWLLLPLHLFRVRPIVQPPSGDLSCAIPITRRSSILFLWSLQSLILFITQSFMITRPSNLFASFAIYYSFMSVASSICWATTFIILERPPINVPLKLRTVSYTHLIN